MTLKFYKKLVEIEATCNSCIQDYDLNPNSADANEYIRQRAKADLAAIILKLLDGYDRECE